GAIFSECRRISTPAPPVMPCVERSHCGRRKDGPASINGCIAATWKRYFARTGNCQVVASVDIRVRDGALFSATVRSPDCSGLCSALISTETFGLTWISKDGPAIMLLTPVTY